VQERLVLVCGASLEILECCHLPGHGVAGVLHLVSEPSLTATRVCAGQVRGHVTRRGTCASTGRMDVSKRGSFWTGVDRRGRWSSKGLSV
jgi:hypothetical protein